MKILRPSSNNEAGSVLLVSLITAAILGLTLASYLVMTRQQYVSVFRSQTWNSSMVMTEAGIEDALALMNKYSSQVDRLTNWSGGASISVDGWTALSANVFHMRRYLGDNYYDVYITNTALTPIISSVGYVPWKYGTVVSAPLTATISAPTLTTPVIDRMVSVQTKVDAAFSVAMAADEQIDFNGKNVTTDSFDSADPNFSDNGMYPASYPLRQKDNGDIVTNYELVNSLNAGNAKIKGKVKTGPNGTVYVGPGGSVGSKGWVEGGTTGIETGYADDDMNILWPSVELPTTTWTVATKYNPPMVVGTNSYDYVLPDGDWYISQLTTKLYVQGNVRLWVGTKLQLTGAGDEIHIGPNGRLMLYTSCTTVQIGGNGVINETGNANNFIMLCTPSTKTISFSGNNSFVGAIYAPDSDFALGGGGATTYDFIGASVTKSVKMNGHYNFHYDENLARNGMGRGYVPTSWKEL